MTGLSKVGLPFLNALMDSNYGGEDYFDLLSDGAAPSFIVEAARARHHP